MLPFNQTQLRVSNKREQNIFKFLDITYGESELFRMKKKYVLMVLVSIIKTLKKSDGPVVLT